jgi:mxaJ protein
MRTLFIVGVVSATLSCQGAPPPSASGTPPLRVCADPNNLPFSNDRGEGFENRLADLIAADGGQRLEYTWWAQRRGFARNTLNAGACDVIMGVPAGYDLAATTQPYYRSSYVFVTRADRALRLRSFDDPRLRSLRVGVQLIGEDFANAPPAHALGRRGIVGNVVGYSVYGDYRQPNPPAAIVSAVARGEVDAAVVWGPLAGFFAARQAVGLRLEPVQPQIDAGPLPFVFDIAMAVRRSDRDLRERLNRFIDAHRLEIQRLLREFHVPLQDGVRTGARNTGRRGDS